MNKGRLEVRQCSLGLAQDLGESSSGDDSGGMRYGVFSQPHFAHPLCRAECERHAGAAEPGEDVNTWERRRVDEG